MSLSDPVIKFPLRDRELNSDPPFHRSGKRREWRNLIQPIQRTFKYKIVQNGGQNDEAGQVFDEQRTVSPAVAP